MFLSPDCPLCHSYTREFKILYDTFKDDFQFCGVLSGDYYTQNEIQHYIDSFHFDFPILIDDDFAFAKQLDAQVTPHFFLLDENGKALYDGRMDNWAIALGRKKLKADSFFLRDAIEAKLNNREISLRHTNPVGCVLEYH